VEKTKTVNCRNALLAGFLKAAAHFVAAFAFKSIWPDSQSKTLAKTTAAQSQTADKNQIL